MKNKIFALLTAVAMTLALTGCGEDKSIVGHWQLKNVTLNGEEQMAGDVEYAFAADGKMTLNGQDQMEYTAKDGSLSFVQNGQDMECSYEISGNTMTLREFKQNDNAQEGLEMKLEKVSD